MSRQFFVFFFLLAHLLCSCAPAVSVPTQPAAQPVLPSGTPASSSTATTPPTHTALPPTHTFTPMPTPTKTPRPTQTATLTPTPIPTETILFQEDFQDKRANGFREYVGKWEVVEDKDGNYVYQGSGPKNYPQSFSNQIYWTDYAFRARIRIIHGGVFICTRALAGRQFYNVLLSAGATTIPFAEYRSPEYKVYKEVQFHPQANRWYTVQVEHLGSLYRLSIDGVLIEEHSDSDRPQVAGGIGFYMSGGDKIQMDDILVWKLTQAKPTP